MAIYNTRAKAEIQELEDRFGASCEVPLPQTIRQRKEAALQAAREIPREAKGHSPEIRLYRRGELALELARGGTASGIPWWMQ